MLGEYLLPPDAGVSIDIGQIGQPAFEVVGAILLKPRQSDRLSPRHGQRQAREDREQEQPREGASQLGSTTTGFAAIFAASLPWSAIPCPIT